jgi:riboflavin biosynthesis pyrimidine reductase
MRFLVLIALAVVAPVLVSAQTVHKDNRELTYPLPAGFNECVRAILSPEKKAQHGFRVAQWDPPLSDEDRASIEYGILHGWGVYQLCDEHDS